MNLEMGALCHMSGSTAILPQCFIDITRDVHIMSALLHLERKKQQDR